MDSPRDTPESPGREGAAGRAERGRAAEDLAEATLRRRGWRILARNLRAGRGEIDLVALHRGALRIVEVRSRTGEAFGDPLESVGPAKRRALQRAVGEALRQGLLPARNEIRFDVVSVVWPRGGGAGRVHVHLDAFDALDL